MPHFGLYILVGVIHFNFFAHTTAHAAQGMLYSRNLILNSTVPLEILVLRSVSLDGLTYLIELLIVLGLIACVGQGLTWGVLGYGVTLVGIIMLTLGVSLLLACAVVFLTDLIYLWSVIIRLLFFLDSHLLCSEHARAPIDDANIGVQSPGPAGDVGSQIPTGHADG